MKVATAVGELQAEYGEQVEFNIVSPEDTAKAGDEIAAFGFTDLRHGLVAFTLEGDAKVKLPGHNFGKPEIVAAIESVLPPN